VSVPKWNAILDPHHTSHQRGRLCFRPYLGATLSAINASASASGGSSSRSTGAGGENNSLEFVEAQDLEALQTLFSKYCDGEGLMNKVSVLQIPAIAELTVRAIEKKAAAGPAMRFLVLVDPYIH
jgi:hypothetical protein